MFSAASFFLLGKGSTMCVTHSKKFVKKVIFFEEFFFYVKMKKSQSSNGRKRNMHVERFFVRFGDHIKNFRKYEKNSPKIHTSEVRKNKGAHISRFDQQKSLRTHVPKDTY